MEIVGPLRGEAEAVRLDGADDARIVEIALGDQRQPLSQLRRQVADRAREVLEERHRALVVDRMHRVEPQAVDVVMAQPAERIVDEEAPHLVGVGAVEVDGGAPRRVAIRPEVRPIAAQAVPDRAEVVIDDVEEDGEAARVAGVDEALQAVRSAVGCVRREQRRAVIAPAPPTRERRHGHQLDVGHAELLQVPELLDRPVERAGVAERAGVQLVNEPALERRGGEAGVGPAERVVVHERAGAEHAAHRLRARVGDRVTAVEAQVVRAHHRRAGQREAAAAGGLHRQALAGAVAPVELQLHPRRLRRPHLEHSPRGRRHSGTVPPPSASSDLMALTPRRCRPTARRCSASSRRTRRTGRGRRARRRRRRRR